VTSGRERGADARAAVVRATACQWHPGPGHGVEIRRLRADRPRGTITGVVRIAAAGARLPGHRHLSPEQLYMLSGIAHIGPLALEAGDYYRTGEGTAHPVTQGDCGHAFLLIDAAVEFNTAR
jgi:anti-sigma factor ChrR (cupin superfamily)